MFYCSLPSCTWQERGYLKAINHKNPSLLNQKKVWDHIFSKYANISEKANISYPLTGTRNCADLGGKKC